jgi:photosystem II stability/assembly factor-like uncharacterized protein
VTPTTLYAGTFGGGVFKSTDGGESWESLSITIGGFAVSGYSVVIDPAMPTTVYVAGGLAGVFKSTDRGTS